MGNAINILALAGSTREASFNKKLVRLGVAAAREAGAEVTLIDLREYPMPLYDGDLEKAEGLPEKAVELKRMAAEHDGFLMAAPEYNHSISGVLKNTIDWMSRPMKNDDPGNVFKGKPAALMSASPGAAGGQRGLVHVRGVLNALGVLVLPEYVAIPKAMNAFDEKGVLKDESARKQVNLVVSALVEITRRIRA